MVDSCIYARKSIGLSGLRDPGRRYPALIVPTEQALCHDWFDRHDIEAADLLLGSHLKLVSSIAAEYRGRGVSTEDLTGEGYVGLMRALCHYDPASDVAFTAYASGWIHACIEQTIPSGKAAVEAITAGAGRATAGGKSAYPSNVRQGRVGWVASRHHAG